MPESNWQNKNLLAAHARLAVRVPVVHTCGTAAHADECDAGFVTNMTMTTSGGHGSRS
jgi:hypothetical protein